MKVPLEWLKDYVTVRLSAKALAERLTMAGLEVTGVEETSGEPVFDVEVTPNRADCLSIIGIAREVATLTGQRLKPSAAQGPGLGTAGTPRQPRAQSREPRATVTIRIEDREGCCRYLGRVLTGLRVAPAPEWMQRRLMACGVRPINNIVDVTNYVLLEHGQPLHAFDLDRLAQGTVLIRRARVGETLTTLDGVARALPPETLVIADGMRPVAVAGVMGGLGSEVTPQTTRVLLESALFDPVTIRRSARRLGMMSESSYRFERGVDPTGVDTASARAAQLLRELAGGTEQSVTDVGTKPAPRKAIIVEPGRLNRWLGASISSPTLRTALARLSCRVQSSGSGERLRVHPPSFRHDLKEEVDLYEEAARVAGYDTLSSTLPIGPVAARRSEETTQYWRTQSLKCLCASLGLTETINWTLISEADLTRIGLTRAQAVKLTNPLSQEHVWLRPSLLVGLLQAVRLNLAQGATSVKCFEVGSVVQPVDRGERLHLGMALSGLWARDWQAATACDFFRLKGLVQALVGRLCDGVLGVKRAKCSWAMEGHAVELVLAERVVGVAGRVARSVTQSIDIEADVWFAELWCDGLLASARSRPSLSAVPVFPPVKRDLSLIVSDGTPFDALQAAIREAGAPLASRIELIDRYTGQQVPRGQYSVTFSIEYRDAARTLTAAEVDVLHQRIGQALISRFAATLR